MKETRSNPNQLDQQCVNDRHVTGYALVFNSLSNDLGGFVEIIEPSALNGVIEKSDVLCLLDHRSDRGVLARSRYGVGSLKLTIDNHGLKYEFDAPQTALGDELLEGIRRGDITSSSFSFTVEADKWSRRADGTALRTIKKITRLYDVSPVYVPAYDGTEVMVDKRGLDELIKDEQTDMEKEQRRADEIIAEMGAILARLEAMEQRNAEQRSDEPKEDSEDEQPINEVKEDETEQNADEPQNDQQPTEDEPKEDSEDEQRSNEEKPAEEPEKEPEDNKEDKENRNNHNIMNKKFSLIGAINSVLNNSSFDETTERVIAEGRSAMKHAGLAANGNIVLPYEMREDPVTSILATKSTHGAETVATEVMPLLIPLRANMILGKAGATIMQGVQSNLSLPTYKASKCSWADEVDMAINGKGEFSDAVLKPRRIVAYLDISKQFIMQQSADAEALLQRDLINCIAERIESTILGAEAGTATRPAGLFNGVTADTTNFKYGDVVDMEAELENNNVNDYVFLANPSAAAQMKKTSTDAGSGVMVMSGGNVDGRSVYTSSAVVNKGLLCVDPKEIFIALFGGLDVVVDNISLAANGKIRIVVTAFVDALLRRPEAAVAKILK